MFQQQVIMKRIKLTYNNLYKNLYKYENKIKHADDEGVYNIGNRLNTLIQNDNLIEYFNILKHEGKVLKTNTRYEREVIKLLNTKCKTTNYFGSKFEINIKNLITLFTLIILSGCGIILIIENIDTPNDNKLNRYKKNSKLSLGLY
ncbi:hypothetical protein MKS88_002221 [Plasmodium brasilianum]|uniref:Uncharacterized protein n=1 Tax=Plasmodium brasilianum TaxID=5824 RepID=A0ACB9Y9I2_PLABR|nr:hypothetical protein MKS88_002221 [Plasmodium brasilianum]